MSKKVWDEFIREHIEIPQEMQSFLREIVAVYRKYNLSISHEDVAGCFQIEPFKEENLVWLNTASKKYTRDVAYGTDIPLNPDYVGTDCKARGQYCKQCKYLEYCFCAWDEKAQKKLIDILSNNH